MNDGLIVTFDDGTCAVYSDVLLYSVLPQAKLIKELEFEE